MKNLTVIIPFRNEKEEIFRTVEGLRENCRANFNIICLNDCSDDGYDYSRLAGLVERYLVNHRCLGVAGCRNLGAKLAKTPYLLFLDAHMRFYTDVTQPIVSYLKKHPRVLACLQTRVWRKAESIKEDPERCNKKACRIHFTPERCWEAEWVEQTADDACRKEIETPCVMGAAYGIGCGYYHYLHGLNGLSGWGYDEQLLSTKVWLEGGRCVLLKELEIGHVYRMSFPYAVSRNNHLRNKLILTMLFTPELLEPVIKHSNDINILPVLKSIPTDWVHAEREYLKQIFTRNMDFIYKLNRTEK